MEWIIYGIWFGCGYMCREIILRGQIKRTMRMIKETRKEVKSMTTEELIKLKEKLNGDNQHSK
jgi:hypothetical protein